MLHSCSYYKLKLCSIDEPKQERFSGTTMVIPEGLEPSRQWHWNLNPARLPIPPRDHSQKNLAEAVGADPTRRKTRPKDLANLPLCQHWVRLRMKRWSCCGDLNPRPADYESTALPTELQQHAILDTAAGRTPLPDGHRTKERKFMRRMLCRWCSISDSNRE